MTTLAADPAADPVEAAIARVLSDNRATSARPACAITDQNSYCVDSNLHRIQIGKLLTTTFGVTNC